MKHLGGVLLERLFEAWFFMFMSPTITSDGSPNLHIMTPKKASPILLVMWKLDLEISMRK